MPRNGDGSSDNGPMEGHEILHGTTGDDSLQHTKHAAPMPAAEHGDALPGMSGGGTAATVPVSINTGAEASTDTSSSSKKRTEPHHASPSRERSELDQKFTKLDSDEVDMSTAQTESQERGARAQRRSDALGDSKPAGEQDMDGVEEARQFGGHADVEELHGATTLEGDKSMSDKKQSGNGGVEVHDADKLQRSKAEKFGGVNLENEGQTGDESMSKEGAAADKKQTGSGHEALESHDADKSKSTKDAAEKKQHNGSEHGNGAVEAHDADKLQRSKAEKFGGVNLENEGQAAANDGNKHVEAENKNEAKHVAEDAAKHTATTTQHDDDSMDIDEKSETHGDAKEQQHDRQNDANKHHAGRKDSLGGDTKGHGNGNAPVEVHEADKLARSKAAKFGGVNLGDA